MLWSPFHHQNQRLKVGMDFREIKMRGRGSLYLLYEVWLVRKELVSFCGVRDNGKVEDRSGWLGQS